jgi:hypothetical protein
MAGKDARRMRDTTRQVRAATTRPWRMTMPSTTKKNATAPMRARAKTSSTTWKGRSHKRFLSSLLTSDYENKPELDKYEAEGIDDEGEHNELDYQARVDIEKRMDQEEKYRL